jgi:hypothetical protein
VGAGVGVTKRCGVGVQAPGWRQSLLSRHEPHGASEATTSRITASL